MIANATWCDLGTRARVLGWDGPQLLVFARLISGRPLTALDHLRQDDADAVVRAMGSEIERVLSRAARMEMLTGDAAAEIKATA